MYRTFSIKNFRCFDELTVEGLGRINLIAGKNNVGKTALLEALRVHSGPTEPERVLRLDSARGTGQIDPESAIHNLFFDFDKGRVIELIAHNYEVSGRRSLNISAQDNSAIEIPLDAFGDDQLDSRASISQEQIVLDYFEESVKISTSRGWLVERTTPINAWTVHSERDKQTDLKRTHGVFLQAPRRTGSVSEANHFSQLEVDGQEGKVLEILQKVEPSLERLVVVSGRQRPSIYANVGLRRLVPIKLLGDGMSHVLALALAIARSPDGMVLVDEIENGLHYTVMEEVWKGIGAFARHYNVQVFATTHSRECVYHAHKAFEADEEEEMRFFRIDRAYGKLRSVMYDKEMREAAFEAGLGIR